MFNEDFYLPLYLPLWERHSTENPQFIMNLLQVFRFSVACAYCYKCTYEGKDECMVHACTMNNTYVCEDNGTMYYVGTIHICILHSTAFTCTSTVNDKDYGHGYSAILEKLYFPLFLCYWDLYECLCQVCSTYDKKTKYGYPLCNKLSILLHPLPPRIYCVVELNWFRQAGNRFLGSL